ncbi:hypothetical protein [Nocardioides sp. SYSU DS0651]|uniref:hypothetical protein n=1 Tax=Nocardioides sp. SYSU DS0651 TaxID=3415955 RepID=UPI003F4BD39D
MNRIRRTAAATVAATALVLAPTTAGIADAAPKHSKAAKASKASKASKAKSQVRQVLQDITVKDRGLARIAVSRTVTRLSDDYEAVLVDSISFDRDDLAVLREEALAADSSYDARAVRTEIRAFRVEIYTQAAGIVREGEKLAVEAAEDAEALALVDLAIESALALNSHSPKSDVAAAKQYLEDAEAELLDVDDPVDPEEPPVDSEDPVEPTA